VVRESPNNEPVRPVLESLEPRLLLSAGAADAYVAVAAGDVAPTAAAPAQVVGRSIFYNCSPGDGYDPQATPADDGAIDASKSALMPGQTPAPANSTSSASGITGIMVDILAPANAGGLTTADFLLKVKTAAIAGAWSDAPPVLHFAERGTAGVGGSNRVTIIWPDHAIQGTWLQVTVLANHDTGLAQPDVFYFGNLPGDANGDGSVDGLDYNAWQNGYNALPATPATGDFNGDGSVDGLDYNAWQNGYGRGLSAVNDRTISADAYQDRLLAMWEGELIGNRAGAAVEGASARGGLTYAVPWTTVTATTPWSGDDDTCFEYLYQQVLLAHTSPTYANIQAAWLQHVPADNFYIANKQARMLMDHGLSAPDTGSMYYNMNWYAIDSQITTEALGAAAPGMRQLAADLAGEFGSVTNDGYALHAAEFYAAMYADAMFETDVEALVRKGLEVVPHTSHSRQVIEDVLAWHAANPADWRATQTLIYDKYGDGDTTGRYRGWIESSVNLAATTMALLYGGKDFTQTVEIAVQAGFDADCNPATAGGLIGLMIGTVGLPAIASDAYHMTSLTGVADTTLSAVAAGWRTVAEQQIIAAGGMIEGTGASRVYRLPPDTVLPPPEKPDPAGPTGLVADVRAAGGTATVSASREYHYAGYDRLNLDSITSGVTDLSYNGRLPYSTYNGTFQQPAGGDWYAISFDRQASFTSLVFTEGDIAWDGINNDPRVVEPRGGYFLNLTVEVGNGGVFTPVTNLTLSEPLDPFKFFQSITLDFDAIQGDAIRIRGDAGGQWQFTSITQLAAYGSLMP